MRAMVLEWLPALLVAALIGSLSCASRVVSTDKREAEHGVPPQQVPATQPSATVSQTIPNAASSARATEHACVMLYECCCNSGCTEINAAERDLRDGAQVEVHTGGLKGTKVFVKKQADEAGSAFFTIQHGDPSAPQLCASALSSPLFGYVCAKGNVGAPRSCKSCSRD
jgi:hypothetical protein